MRIVICLLIILMIPFNVLAQDMRQPENEKESFIIEVNGDPNKHKEHLERYYPFIEIIAVYEKLFNGLAFKTSPDKLNRLLSIDDIRAIYPAQTYETITPSFVENDLTNPVIPSELNTTDYTGKGVKVAVIDTGIDYHHEDLVKNYAGGYDLIDLDEDPMETTEQEGIPTSHGTHVAGIIAANGSLKGVAPGAKIYAYRALGPGGKGSSVQVIAAMEQAINDGVDVINLSLGNSVNGPDYPTSIAVNRAIELGTAVVIANGNDGPNHWTVGAPATASQALSVGASSNAHLLPVLYEASMDKLISITMMHGSIPWAFKKDYAVVDIDEEQESNNIKGKIAVTSRNDQTFYEKAKNAQNKGAIALLIYNNASGSFQGTIENEKNPIHIPVAAISKRDGEWLVNQSKGKTIFINTYYEEIDKNIALFSSRGPVTMNWQIKPEILAPGTNILSTVPGGYQILQGTSMAAPHVTGAIAIIKEARPEWNNEQIIGAIKTTAKQFKTKDGKLIDPIEQGMGEIQLEKAIDTKTIIADPLLSFGKVENYREIKVIDLIIENTTNETLTYTFDPPKKQKGLTWNLPLTFDVQKKEKKEIPIQLDITSQRLEEGLHQGWLTLNQGNEKYRIPYLLMNQTANYPKTAGFEFSLKSFSEDTYTYKIYIVEENAKRLVVHLYNPDTLIYDRKLFELKDLQLGINEGDIDKREIGETGVFRALITIELENGQFESYETRITIE